MGDVVVLRGQGLNVPAVAGSLYTEVEDVDPSPRTAYLDPLLHVEQSGFRADECVAASICLMQIRIGSTASVTLAHGVGAKLEFVW